MTKTSISGRSIGGYYKEGDVLKLGSSREEMQENYVSLRKGSRKVGIVLMCIFLVTGIWSRELLLEIFGTFMPASALKVPNVVLIILYALLGYAEGHLVYFAWKRVEEWSCAISGEEDDGENLIGFVFTIIYHLMLPIMFSIGLIFGIYDWIKLHIDGKIYGLKVK